MAHEEQHVSPEQIEQAVEQVCNLGCAAVYRILDEVDRGVDPEPLSALPSGVRSHVVAELRSIMAVYDAREGGASCKLERR